MRRIILIAAVAVAAVSCSSSSSTDAPSTTILASGSGSATANVDTTTPGVKNASPSDDVPQTTLPPVATTTAIEDDGASCLVGFWDLDMQLFLDSVMEIGGEQAAGAVMTHVSGAYTMTLNADLSGVEHRDALGIEIAVPEGAMTMIVTDLSPGSYTADGNAITWETEPRTDEAVVEFLLNGELFKLPTEAMPVDPPEASFTAGTYVCSGDVLKITADGFSSTWSRIG